MAAAAAALNTNTTTFSVLEIGDILEKDGLIAQLQAKGYAVDIAAE